jgi:hypothetical protein
MPVLWNGQQIEKPATLLQICAGGQPPMQRQRVQIMGCVCQKTGAEQRIFTRNMPG